MGPAMAQGGRAAGPKPAKSRKRGNRRKLSQESVDRLARHRERKAAKEAGRSAVSRFLKSDFAERRVAGMMRFVFAGSRALGRERASRIASRVTRSLAPMVSREHRLAAENIAAAFPEKSERERAAILAGVWDSLARHAVEYAFLQDIVDAFDPERPDAGPIVAVGIEHAIALRESGRPAILFGAHLGNFELIPALGAKLGLPVTALYRPPANPHIAEEIERRRSAYLARMVVSGKGAALEVAAALKKGRHIGVLVDQRIAGGQVIPFFGRPSLSNPIVGILARIFDCPVHGGYAVRLPDGRFRAEMTPPLVLPRDGSGRIDAEAANVVVHGMVEQWIRQHPEQWLWVHDRWRLKRRKYFERVEREGGG
jgi:KDO2-lipid IV(A) lauroyltransferase